MSTRTNTHMLNADIWNVVVEALRGDTATLRACALTCSHVCGSMQRELFRTIKIPKWSYTAIHRFVEILLPRPSLVSYIRRVEVEKHESLDVLLNFARPRPAGSASLLAGVQELRLSGIRDPDMSVREMESLSECFPCLLVLELHLCYWTPLKSMPTIFPTLQVLALHDTTSNGSPATVDANALRLGLKAFSYTCSLDPFPLSRIRPFVERCLIWEQLERLGVHGELGPRLWPPLRGAGTKLRHLFIQDVYVHRPIDFVKVQLPSCDLRSNTLLAGLQTLAISIRCLSSRKYNTVLRSFAALVDSIPSASLVFLTLVFEYPKRAGLMDLDWSPVTDAVRRLHQDLSPRIRKRLRVAIVGDEQYAEAVCLIETVLRPVQVFADVDVFSGSHHDFATTSPVPHFSVVL